MNYITLGGVTVGLCILTHRLATWWPGYRPLRKDAVNQLARLLPFILGWAYGCLTTLGIAGLIGLISGTILGVSNWLGDTALVWGVGGEYGESASRKAYLPLTSTGSATLLILTVVFLVAIKKNSYGVDVKHGAWCGITLGTSTSIAGAVAIPLAQAVNWFGSIVYGAVQ